METGTYLQILTTQNSTSRMAQSLTTWSLCPINLHYLIISKIATQRAKRTRPHKPREISISDFLTAIPIPITLYHYRALKLKPTHHPYLFILHSTYSALMAFLPTAPLSIHRHHAVPHVCRRVNHVSTRVPKMVLSPKETDTIRITGNNVTITDNLRAYINDKLGKVSRKFFSIIGKMDVHLTVEHNPSVPNRHKAEVVAFSGKTILRTEIRSEDMYAAIDAAEDKIGRKIRKFKERKESKTKAKQGIREKSSAVAFDAAEEEEEDDEFKDVYSPSDPLVPEVTEVVKRKVFPMPLQTVEEAVLCCEYVDHPWYLFRNAASGDICLVYKRNHGGYGLIEPSKDDVVDEEPI